MARRRILAALGLVIAAAVFLPPQLARVQLSADRYVFNDDARQWTVPFLGGALQEDWTSRYYRAITPIGERALYATGNAETLSKVLPLVLFAITCAFVAMTAFAMTRDFAAAVIAVCFLFSTAALMARMTGGASRAFAFPVLAACAYGLASGKLRVSAIATAAGAAFYPPAGVLAGVALALVGARRHARLIAVTAIVSLALLLPMMLSSRAYGSNDVARFPEAGPHGRYSPGDRPPFPNVFEASYRAMDWGLKPAGERLVPPPLQGGVIARAIVLAFAVIGLLWVARPLGALLVASVLLYVVAVWLSPRLFIPTRYVAYSLVLLPSIAIPIVIFKIARPSVAIAASIVLLLLIGGRGSGTAGFTVNARSEAPLYERIAAMQDATLVAGWPTGPIDNVPYLSRKPALVTYETHAAFHTQALLTMRTRMHALIAAYFATSPEPLVTLRDQFGVTHLLVDKRHFTEAPPRYFAPFDVAIRSTVQRMHAQTPEVARHRPVFAYGPYILLDLREVR